SASAAQRSFGHRSPAKPHSKQKSGRSHGRPASRCPQRSGGKIRPPYGGGPVPGGRVHAPPERQCQNFLGIHKKLSRNSGGCRGNSAENHKIQRKNGGN